VPCHVVDEAVRLRKELPSRSVRRIIEILEGEKTIKPGEICRTSLNRHLVSRGYGASQLRAKGKASMPAKRFERKQKNSLWQSDIVFGPEVNVYGKNKKTYLLAILDDKTRMVMHAEFYDNQRIPILEDCFRKALLKFGKPKDILVDNGKIFISKWFLLACARFGIRHIKARPYSPQTKGKTEKFNQGANRFMEEFSLEREQTLSNLNRQFAVWLDEGYIHDSHEALKITERNPKTGEILSEEEVTPYQAYVRDPAKIQYVSSLECRDAFLWEESKKVDKSGCIKLSGIQYDVGAALVRKRVDIRYDPFDISIIEVWHEGKFMRKAEKLYMPEYTPRQEAPMELPSNKPTHSRLLKVYGEKNKEREKQRNAALDFSGSKPKEEENY
jgi:transposase InsO family protein